MLVSHRLLRYVIAVLCVAVAALLCWAAAAIFDVTPFLAFYPAVVAAAAFGGLGPGLLATVLSALCVDIVFTTPEDFTDIMEPIGAMRMGVFILGGSGVAILAWLWRRNTASLETQAERLRESKERTSLMLRAADLGTWDWNLVTDELTWSRRCLELFGLPPGETVTYEKFMDRVHPQDQHRVKAAVHAAVEGGKDYDVEIRAVWQDGSEHWVASRGRAYYDKGGRPLRLTGAAMDIDQRKRAAAETALLAAIVSGSADAVVGEALDHRIITWNDGARRLFGYTAEEALGQPVALLVPPDRMKEEHEMQQRLEAGDRVQGLETFRRAKDGCLIPVSISASAIRDRDGRLVGYAKIKHDISDRRQAEEALKNAILSAERARELAQQANQAKDDFLAVLSHELRNPLTPVLAAAVLLEEDSRLNAEMRDQAEMIRRNAELEARLIDDLLDVTRISRGKVELDKHSVSLRTILDRAVEVCRPDLEARGLHFALSGPACPLIVEADAARLQQVFWNLLKNAVKFTPHGGCVGVRCLQSDTQVVVEVSDSGIGIEPEKLSHIFRPFEQGGRETTRQFGGLGLGLTISKAMVEMHGGRISVQSEGRGRGSVFTVQLPLSQEQTTARPPAAPSPEASGITEPAKLKVLLVEDHGDTARIMTMLLRREGHDVWVAGDVATALSLIAGNRFDVLISDLGLPDGSGHDLVRALRERGQQLPAIAVSGYGQERDVQQSREAGFFVHLTKPVSLGRLKEAMAVLRPAQAAAR